MPPADIDEELHLALRDFDKLWRLRSRDVRERGLCRKTLLRARVDVEALGDADAAGRELHERVGDLGLARVRSGGGELAHDVPGIVVRDDAGKQIALRVHEAHGVRVAVDEEVAAARDGVRHEIGYRRAGDDTHAYLGRGRVPSKRDFPALRIAHLDKLARGRVPAFDSAGEHPRVALQDASLPPFPK